MSHGFGHSGGSSSHGSSRGFGHSHLHGTQAKFDRNGDGRLSGLEWSNWYYDTYGMDIEIAERRKQRAVISVQENRAQACFDAAEDWFTDNVTDDAEDIFGAPLPDSIEKELTKVYFHFAMQGVLDSGEWNRTRTLPAGEMAPGVAYNLGKPLLRALAQAHPGIASFTEISAAMERREPLFRAEAGLTDEFCGSFWRQCIEAEGQRLIRDEELYGRFSFRNGEWLIRHLLRAGQCLAGDCDSEVSDAKLEPYFDALDVHFEKRLAELRRQYPMEYFWGNEDKEDDRDELEEPEDDEPAPARSIHIENMTIPPPDPDDGTMYTFCMVRFPKIRRAYSYLCGGTELKTGDFVRVPFGRYDAEYIGEVMAVASCPAPYAPYPPSKMKTVIGKTDKPQDWDERMQAADQQVKKPVSQPAAPAPAKIEETPTQPQETAAPSAAEEPPKPQSAEVVETPEAPVNKKRRIWPVIAAVAAVLVIAGVLLSAYLPRARERAAVYQEAIAYLNSEDYDLAWQKFHSIETYRDAEALATYCQYAEIYTDIPDLYRGGEKELGAIKLYFNR